MAAPDEVWTKTVAALQPCVPNIPLEAHMARPPFKFLHDIFLSMQRELPGMFPSVSEAEWDIKNINSKEEKVAFLDKILACVEKGVGKKIDVLTKKIVTGSETEKTNAFMLDVAMYHNLVKTCGTGARMIDIGKVMTAPAAAAASRQQQQEATATSAAAVPPPPPPPPQGDENVAPGGVGGDRADKAKKEKKHKSDKKGKEGEAGSTRTGDNNNENSASAITGSEPPPPPPPGTPPPPPSTAPHSDNQQKQKQQQQQQPPARNDDDDDNNSRPATSSAAPKSSIADDPVKAALAVRATEFRNKVSKFGLSFEGADLTPMRMAESAIKMKQEIDASKKDASEPPKTGVEMTAEQLEVAIQKQLDLIRQVDKLIKGNAALVEDLILHAVP